MTLIKDVPQAEIQIYFENEALDHRLGVRFQTGLKVDTARMMATMTSSHARSISPRATAPGVSYPAPKCPNAVSWTSAMNRAA